MTDKEKLEQLEIEADDLNREIQYIKHRYIEALDKGNILELDYCYHVFRSLSLKLKSINKRIVLLQSQSNELNNDKPLYLDINATMNDPANKIAYTYTYQPGTSYSIIIHAKSRVKLVKNGVFVKDIPINRLAEYFSNLE